MKTVSYQEYARELEIAKKRLDALKKPLQSPNSLSITAILWNEDG